MKVNYDILIMGAGPAGTSTAYTAAKLGLKCLVIDKKLFPRDKICGDLILPLPFELADILTSPTAKATMNEANLHNTFSYYFKDKKTSYESGLEFGIMPRRQFDDELLRLTRGKGVDILLGIAEYSINRESTCFSVLVNGESKVLEVKAKVIISAEGVNSSLRNNFFPDFRFKKGVACRAYIENIELQDCYVRFLESDDFGYFWQFPLADNTANTGVFIPDIEANKQLYRYYFEMTGKYFSQYEVSPKQLSKWTLALFSESQTPAKDGLFLVGDAAALTDPLFGHGIDTAMFSGQYLAEALFANNLDWSLSAKEYRAKLDGFVYPILQTNKVLLKELTANTKYFYSNFEEILHNNIHEHSRIYSSYFKGGTEEDSSPR